MECNRKSRGLGVWERIHNPGFNSLEFEGIRNEAGRNSFFPVRQVVGGRTLAKGRIASARTAHDEFARTRCPDQETEAYLGGKAWGSIFLMVSLTLRLPMASDCSLNFEACFRASRRA